MQEEREAGIGLSVTQDPVYRGARYAAYDTQLMVSFPLEG
jgi:hypothetical protein